jgi:hypothetical protein
VKSGPSGPLFTLDFTFSARKHGGNSYRCDDRRLHYRRKLFLLKWMPPSSAGRPPRKRPGGGWQGLRRAWSRYERQAASPGSTVAIVRLIYESHVRAILPAIRVPTLVIHRAKRPGFELNTAAT